MNQIYKFLKSVKLATVLILYITATSLLATLVPQGKDIAYYNREFSAFTAWLITTTKFNSFFSSFFFIIPSGLFFLNLLVCTTSRLIRQLKKKGSHRYGPDILHIGLLVLLVGAFITFTQRKSAYITLGPGDGVSLPGGYHLVLKDFEFLTYPNGTPKDWISTVNIEKDEKLVIELFPIEVNRPLKVGNINIYQNSYSTEYSLTLETSSGNAVTISPGRSLSFQGNPFIYVGNEREKAVFQNWKDNQLQAVLQLGPGDKAAGYIVKSLNSRNMTGLEAVVDPGFIPALAGFILIILGLFLTYYQKLGEKTE